VSGVRGVEVDRSAVGPVRPPRGARISRALILGPIRFYQRFVSPLFPPVCRFYPCCSDYAVEAVKQHGVGRGLGLAARRLLRCHPFHRGGFDPVPTERRRREDG
jgi:putative membrane protein insertion efficiency factor